MVKLVLGNCLLLLLLMSCQNAETNKNMDQGNAVSDSNIIAPDSNLRQQTDGDTLQRIRSNFERVNAITDWDRIDSAYIHESTEGGQAKYYIKNDKLELIKVKNYGEGGYTFQDYYPLNNELSFVYEEVFQYNTHIIDPKFDMDKTKKSGEVRYYFKGGKLFKAIATDKEMEAYIKDSDEMENALSSIYNKLIKIKENGYNPKGISE